MRETTLCDLANFAVEGERFTATCPRCNLPAKWWTGQRAPIRPCDPEFATKYLEAIKNPPKPVSTTRPSRAVVKVEPVSEEAKESAFTILGYTPKQIGRWAKEVKAWFATGCPKRTDEEVAAILEICKSNVCKIYKPSGHCGKCGCNLNDSQYAVFSAARMATKKCPKGLW
jgi:hypothetical protein